MSEQLILELEAVTDWLPQSTKEATKNDQEQWFQCYTLDHDKSAAVNEFEGKFGYPPDKIYQEAGLLWAGPVHERSI